VKVINTTKNTVLAENAVLADTCKSRIIGLLNRKLLSPGEGLVISRCNSIHTFFMKFSIDAVFISKKGVVVKILHNLKPWRISGVYWSAFYCVELPSGTAFRTHTEIGNTISFQ